MDEEETEVTLELADDGDCDIEQAADEAARLLVEVRDRRASMKRQEPSSKDAERTAGDG